MPNLICIIGIDGSGKTTHAQGLLLNMKRRKIKCKYVWLRRPYFLSFPFMVTCRVLGLAEVYHTPNDGTFTEHQYYKSKPIAMLWPWVQFVDLILMVTLLIYLPLWKGYFIVCDRFIHDLLVDVMADLHEDRLYKKFVGKLMLKLIPRSAIVVLFDEEPSRILCRKTDVPDLTYLAVRRRLYHLIAAELLIPVVGTEKGIDLVHKNLVSLLETEGVKLS